MLLQEHLSQSVMSYKTYFVYIITNYKSTVFYTGVTNALERRMYEHKQRRNKRFAARYNCDRLVYFEAFGEITEAIYREKGIKRMKRMDKDHLIIAFNPRWKDLSSDWDV